MKAFLMHADRDFDRECALPPNEAALAQDLELQTLLNAMAAGDPFLFDVARRALLLGLRDPGEIAFRQQVLTDCLRQPSLVRELFDLAVEAVQAQKRVWRALRDSPSTLLSSSVSKMQVLVDFLRRLRTFADEHADAFESPGFTRLYRMLGEELDEPYFALVDEQLKALRFKGGMLMSARLGQVNRGTDYVLRQPRQQSLLGRVFDRSGHAFTIPDRDQNGLRALSELQDRGLNLVANALAQSVDHVVSFFEMLCVEVGFYVACLNLSERLAQRQVPTTLPEPRPASDISLQARDLRDVCLALTLEDPVVGNDVDADGKSLVVITGANQGGKSTFLRSVGLAQLMLQAGMFVGARSLRASVCAGIFTHHKREEDEAMESGKLDEELARMSDIVDHIAAGGLLLCNESFAATNEREGSEIARQVIDALLEHGVRIVFVTHMFDLAASLHRRQREDCLFLRAQRGADGARPYRLTVGEPLPTSFGADSYRKVFGVDVSDSDLLRALERPRRAGD